MILTIGILQAIIFLCPFVYFFFFCKKDIFRPESIFSLLSFLLNSVYIIYLHFDKSIYPEIILKALNEYDINKIILKYSIVHLVFFIAVLLGIRMSRDASVKIIVPKFKNELKLITLSVVIATVSIPSFVYYVNSNGGLFFILLNLGSRIKFITGNGYLLSLVDLFPLCLYSLLLVKIKADNFFSLSLSLLIFVILLLTILFQISLGGRKDTIFTILTIIIFNHYYNNRIKEIPLRKALILGIFISAFFIIMPLLRYSEGQESLNKSVRNAILENTHVIVEQLSYVQQYSFIVNYFNKDNIWYGSSFKDLLYAPIPRKYYEDKPPVDDGVYISNMVIKDKYYKPPYPFRHFEIPSSWPPETLGIAYANFSFLGVVVLGFLLGRIYLIVYKIMINSRYEFFAVYMYSYVMFNFQLSNIRIVATLTHLTIILILMFIILIPFGLFKNLKIVRA